MNISENPSLPANQRKVRIGGLMRCCLATIDESAQLTQVGDTMHCKYERPESPDSLRVAPDGVWEWNHA